MSNISILLPPKDVIRHYSKVYIQEYLTALGFEFKESQLLYQRKMQDFTQVISYRCSLNNIKGHIVDFEIGYGLRCRPFKTWYQKTYGKEPVGGDALIGVPRLRSWDKGRFVSWYDLINEDVEAQHLNILHNLHSIVMPHFDHYKDFDAVIEGCEDKVRQIEYCLYLGYVDKAKALASALLESDIINQENEDYIKTELERALAIV